jgi:FKBP-type peptidyl-prolyl cis-trans isomerase SlyD
MEIAKNRMITLTYNLMLDNQDGEVIEQVTTERPLQFLYGAGMMLPEFESNLAGLNPGESFEISLGHNDAYGEVNDEAIVDVPMHIFMTDGHFDEDFIKVGNTIPMMSGGGQQLNGLVLQVSDNSVRMDFNHPLAGEDLFFKGEILEVREASEEEIVKILSGGCDCGSCSSSGCDSGCCSE